MYRVLFTKVHPWVILAKVGISYASIMYMRGVKTDLFSLIQSPKGVALKYGAGHGAATSPPTFTLLSLICISKQKM